MMRPGKKPMVPRSPPRIGPTYDLLKADALPFSHHSRLDFSKLHQTVLIPHAVETDSRAAWEEFKTACQIAQARVTYNAITQVLRIHVGWWTEKVPSHQASQAELIALMHQTLLRLVDKNASDPSGGSLTDVE